MNRKANEFIVIDNCYFVVNEISSISVTTPTCALISMRNGDEFTVECSVADVIKMIYNEGHAYSYLEKLFHKRTM